MLGKTDPKTLSDEALHEKITKCREYLSYSSINNNHGTFDSIQNILLLLEEEAYFRIHKRLADGSAEVKRKEKQSVQYPINIGHIEGDVSSAKKDQ